MASPVTFQPQPVDPHLELMKKVESAPRDHAEALLLAWDVLQSAHDQGMLDLLHGVLGGRDLISGKLAVMAKSEEGINLIRNMLALGRILASVDPEVLQRFGKALEYGAQAHHEEEKTPGLISLFLRLRSEDSRRGLSFITHMLTELGRATRDAKS